MRGSDGTLYWLVEDYVLKMLFIGSEVPLVEFRETALCERNMQRYIGHSA